jgi:hypothetical protein
VTGEALCRSVILGRTGHVCEGCRSQRWTDKAHRVAASAGGRWRPANVLGLCRACHGWAHAQPAHARAAGWMLTAGTDPELEPVFLASASLIPGWYLLDGDGSPCDADTPLDRLALPQLPPHFPRELLPPTRITVEP